MENIGEWMVLILEGIMILQKIMIKLHMALVLVLD